MIGIAEQSTITLRHFLSPLDTKHFNDISTLNYEMY
jgi:hypothetical protein